MRFWSNPIPETSCGARSFSQAKDLVRHPRTCGPPTFGRRARHSRRPEGIRRAPACSPPTDGHRSFPAGTRPPPPDQLTPGVPFPQFRRPPRRWQRRSPCQFLTVCEGCLCSSHCEFAVCLKVTGTLRLGVAVKRVLYRLISAAYSVGVLPHALIAAYAKLSRAPRARLLHCRDHQRCSLACHPWRRWPGGHPSWSRRCLRMPT